LFWWLKKGVFGYAGFLWKILPAGWRVEIFCKTEGLNLHTLKTRIYLCHRTTMAGWEGMILKWRNGKRRTGKNVI